MFVYKFEAFNTPCEVQFDTVDKKFADEVSKLIHLQTKYLEQKYSFFNPDSALSKFNNRSTNTPEIDVEFYNLLLLAEFYYKITCGAFDVATAGTINSIRTDIPYNQYQNIREEIVPFASFQNIKLHNYKVTLSNSITKIDFGGFVKEYAVDQALMILEQHNIKNALVNFGGDIAVIGKFYDKEWCIEITNPNASSQLITLTDAICTSGHTVRYTMIDNQKISHIQSKKQIYNNSTQQISVTAPTTVDAGVWSTALLIDPQLVLPEHIHII